MAGWPSQGIPAHPAIPLVDCSCPELKGRQMLEPATVVRRLGRHSARSALPAWNSCSGQKSRLALSRDDGTLVVSELAGRGEGGPGRS